MSTEIMATPRAYIKRRLHSILGLMIVLFLLEHLLTNSQAALLVGDNGMGFIRAVNFIKDLPYLPVLEITLIAVPILVHAVLGVKYALTAKNNCWPSKGDKPSLTEYPRNHAYTWQRITSWILLVGIILHVGYMRFYRYPLEAEVGDKTFYFTRLDLDPGLYTVADRLNVELYGSQEVLQKKQSLDTKLKQAAALEKEAIAVEEEEHPVFSKKDQALVNKEQNYQEQARFLQMLTKKSLQEDQVMAVSQNFGTATLLMVRDAFKSPIKASLYTVFVLAACFHAFNGLWTFCITWGWVIRAASQRRVSQVCMAIMVVMALLGLASVWGTYWLNLAK